MRRLPSLRRPTLRRPTTGWRSAMRSTASSQASEGQSESPVAPPGSLASAGRTATPAQVLIGLIVCLAVTGLLSTARLVTMAERQEFGSTRENWLEAAETLHEAAAGLKLDKPASAIEDLLHEDPATEVVVGELASDQDTGTRGASKDASSTLSKSVGSEAATEDSLGNTPTTVVATPTTAPSTTAPATTVPSTTVPETTSTLPPLRDISSSEPIRVWAGGDSLGEYVGSRLQYKVADLDLSTFTLDYHISTGIARPDYFDWPANLSNVMLANDDPATRPEAIVYMVGGNDDQPMLGEDGKLATNSAEWLVEYRTRVGLMMDITAYPGIRFYWVGLPPMQDDRREAIAVNVNAILAEEAALRDWVTFVDIVPLLLGPEGDYQQYVVGPDGEPHKAREGDGVHVTARASQWISTIIWDLIQADWTITSSSP